MSDFQTAATLATETMRDPPPVTSKLSALDGLDRLALNPSGWFPVPVLKKMDDARVAIIVDRWKDALITLEEAHNAMEEFIEVLEKQDGPESKDAVSRARNELKQCEVVQAYVGARTADES